jgi:hypothetical protein
MMIQSTSLPSLLILATLLSPPSHPQATLPPRSPQGDALSATCRAIIYKMAATLTHNVPGETRSLDGFGMIMWLPGGPFQIHVKPCDGRGKLADAGWFWYHTQHPLNVYLSTGSVRHASLAASGQTAIFCAAGATGATYCKNRAGLPDGFGVRYFGSHPSVLFDNGRNGFGTALYIEDHALRFFDLSKQRPTPPP